MKRVALVVLICLNGWLFAEGFSISKPDAVGGNLVAMTQDQATLQSGMPVNEGLVIGPGIEFFLKYDVSPKFFMTIGTGLHTLNYDIKGVSSSRTTLLPTFELRGAYKLTTGSQFSPYLTAGAYAFGWQNTTKFGGQTFNYPDKRAYDGALFVGAGAEYAINEKLTLQASGDLRFVITSDEDPQPQYWVAKAGLSYQLNGGREESPLKEEIEYPLGDDELASLDDLFKDSGSDDGFDDLNSLFSPEEESASSMSESYDDNSYDELFDDSSDASYASADSRTLQNRINELKQKMDAGYERMQTLETQVKENERILAGLTGDIAGDYAGISKGEKLSDSEFKRRYDSTLQKVNSRKYKEAIPEFMELMASNPDHKLASNCQYWIGECYNGMGDYSKAIQAFNRVLDYRSSYKFDDALIMTGVCSMKLGDNENAKQKFQELVDRYPDSEYMPKAMKYLGKF